MKKLRRVDYCRKSIELSQYMLSWRKNNRRKISGLIMFNNARQELEAKSNRILKGIENNKKKIIWREIK
jgi:hypothetical protein